MTTTRRTTGKLVGVGLTLIATVALLLWIGSCAKGEHTTKHVDPAKVAAVHYSNEHKACHAFVVTTRAANEGAPDFLTTAAQVTVQAVQDHEFSPVFSRDAMKVMNTGLAFPEPAAVAQLHRDCEAVGVAGSIWPANMTGTG